MHEQGHVSLLSTSPNKLLARLSPDDYRRLLPDLQTIGLRPKCVLLKPHVPVQKIYFLGGGVCSINRVTADGQMAGVAMVGNEGLIGMSAFEADFEPSETAVVEVPDDYAQVGREGPSGAKWSAGLPSTIYACVVDGLMQSVACNDLARG